MQSLILTTKVIITTAVEDFVFHFSEKTADDSHEMTMLSISEKIILGQVKKYMCFRLHGILKEDQ